ncbi:unnamed protein product [Linum trigynum]|uniref:IST1-like protein n=1 Tax=Linum trigynum TaxID=586398 RepID=A0AAV2GYS2_9ROSI
MLDGLLGRGFAAKCKSLIKQSKSRIDVIRRKRSATLKFLKKDVADLLANGLDINAYGRAEGLVGELVLSSCYDFVERCCDLVLKHLSVLQKMRHCAEDCREAVSSLMFAAARFSDLPELRDLRQLFLERYGDSLELYVNQGFVDSISAKPVTTEKKVQLLRDVASEFSIRWDSTGFEQRISRPSPVKAQLRSPSLAGCNKSDLTNAKDNINIGVKQDVPSRAGEEQNDNRGFRLIKEEKPDWKRDNPNPPHQRKEVPSMVNKLQNGGENETTLRKTKYDSSPPARPEIPVVKKHEIPKQATPPKTVGLGSSSRRTQQASIDDRLSNTPPKSNGIDTTTHGKPEPSPSYAGMWAKVNSKDPLTVNASPGQHSAAKITRDALEDEAQKFKSFYNNAIPPPYTRPNTKPKDTKSAINASASPTTVLDTGAVDTSRAQERSNHGYRSENNDPRPAKGADEHVFDTKVYYQGETVVNPIPKPRPSSRRRHQKPQPSHDAAGGMESAGVAKRKSRIRNRKDDSRRGLQILFDDEEHQNDEEEKIIDKLLIHYSKKPTAFDPEPSQVRRKSSRSSSRHHSRDPTAAARDDVPVSSHPSRSFSLPSEQPSAAAPPQGNKVFARAATLEPDRSAAARHVHPKLPDYDDLTARFAALKGR